MDALTLEQEVLKLTPLARILLADLLYTSLEVEADCEWNHKAIAECESRYEAYKNGEMGSVDALKAIDALAHEIREMNPRFIDACLAEIDEAVRWYSEQSPELTHQALSRCPRIHEGFLRQSTTDLTRTVSDSTV